MNGTFTKIDVGTWPRAQEYGFFTKAVPLGFSLTVDLDVTKTRKALKKKSTKFCPAFLWLLTGSINKQNELKTDEQDGVVGFWDVLHPMYPVLHEDKSLSMMWTRYDDSFSVFYRRYLDDNEKFGATLGFLSQPDNPPPLNTTVITQLPWINFKHFAFHLDVNKPHLPSFGCGRFSEKGRKTTMPFSVNVNHCIADGWHVHRLIEDVQNRLHNPDSWL